MLPPVFLQQNTHLTGNTANVMENRIALLGIIVEDDSASSQVNELLHEFRQFVVGRMGIPYRPQQLAIISVVLDAPPDVISTLAGKLGQLPQISVKTVYAKTRSTDKGVQLL